MRRLVDFLGLATLAGLVVYLFDALMWKWKELTWRRKARG